MNAVEKKGPELQSLALALISLAWLGVALRAYTRFYIVKKITWDDRFVAASLYVCVPPPEFGVRPYDTNIDPLY